EQIFASDRNWKSATGPILMSEIYHGETCDARLEKTGWTEPGYDDRDWSGVKVAAHGKDILIAQSGPPVRKIQELKPVRIFTTPAGDTAPGMGPNKVGWVMLSVHGPAGTALDPPPPHGAGPEGNFSVRKLPAG